uniref:Forkhead-associated (FHA) phosphopeptide binding domain 1 n=1 Tax=Erpetoichthys calabaricus TaxID=27687 RepID=A0A8C4SG43_ERPCA
MRAYLKTSEGLFPLRPKTTSLGRRDDCDLCLQNSGIEDRHALIDFSETEGCFVLRDLNSQHGSFVNDCRIQNASVRLAPRDVLRFGFGGPTYELIVEHTPSVCMSSNILQEQRLLRLEDEVSRLLLFEADSRNKDIVIASLRDKVTSLQYQVSQNGIDNNMVKKPQGLEKDIMAKEEEIQVLREQVQDYLQRDISVRDQQVQRLSGELEKLRQEIRERDSQLSAMSTKVGTFYWFTCQFE